MSRTRVCAVFGDPIEHSLSPVIHQFFAKQCGIPLLYEAHQITVDSFTQSVTNFFAKGGLGLNITLPLKELAYQMANICTPAAKQAKAANTLWMDNNQLVADNTDGLGLVTDILNYLPLTNQCVHILGAGGAARGIIQPLLDAGIQSLSLSNRTKERALALQSDFPALTITPWQELISGISILINTTSAAFTSQPVAWPECSMKGLKLVYDLTYSRTAETPCVKHYRQLGRNAVDGMGMLIEQAAISFERWHHVHPDTASIRRELIKPL